MIPIIYYDMTPKELLGLKLKQGDKAYFLSKDEPLIKKKKWPGLEKVVRQVHIVRLSGYERKKIFEAEIYHEIEFLKAIFHYNGDIKEIMSFCKKNPLSKFSSNHIDLVGLFKDPDNHICTKTIVTYSKGMERLPLDEFKSIVLVEKLSKRYNSLQRILQGE